MRLTPETIERVTFLRREIDRLIREVSQPNAEGEAAYALTVAADVYEVDGTFVFEIEAPGMTKADIEIFVLHDILVVEGVKRNRDWRRDQTEGTASVVDDARGTRANFICMEREFGRFRKVLEIPAAGDTSRVGATIDNGILTIRLPKIEERRGQRRRVTVSEK
ncbi:MAG: Hsp20/alpha crystallin family protein [Deltaproteobacteria bacterium]|nr:Hsp20/alpha crystallin family protein [Deltaproteobacteria bacterium]